MKRIQFLLGLSASLLIAGRSFALQGRGQGRAGAPSTPGVAGNANPGNPGGGSPAIAKPGGGNPGGNSGGGNPGGGNPGGGNPGGGNPGSGNPGGGNRGGSHHGGGNPGGSNPGGSDAGKNNSGGDRRGNGNASGGNSGHDGSGDHHPGGGNQPASAPDLDGFKNHGQYVAAKHVSENLGIPLEDLRSKITGRHPGSLGQAIQELKGLSPTAANAEAKKAQQQAKSDGKKK